MKSFTTKLTQLSDRAKVVLRSLRRPVVGISVGVVMVLGGGVCFAAAHNTPQQFAQDNHKKTEQISGPKQAGKVAGAETTAAPADTPNTTTPNTTKPSAAHAKPPTPAASGPDFTTTLAVVTFRIGEDSSPITATSKNGVVLNWTMVPDGNPNLISVRNYSQKGTSATFTLYTRIPRDTQPGKYRMRLVGIEQAKPGQNFEDVKKVTKYVDVVLLPQLIFELSLPEAISIVSPGDSCTLYKFTSPSVKLYPGMFTLISANIVSGSATGLEVSTSSVGLNLDGCVKVYVGPQAETGDRIIKFTATYEGYTVTKDLKVMLQLPVAP